MAQKKTHEVDSWLARPDPAVAVVLVYGPDRGLVSERAARFAASTGLAPDDPFAVVKLDASEVERDPGRLLDEAATVSMFGGRRLIWLRNAGAQKPVAEAIALLAGRPPVDCAVLVEAGDLKKGAPLRNAVENASAGMALPCFADERRMIDELIGSVLSQAGKTIDPEARQLLHSLLGGDRLASRSELDKLLLYLGDRRQVSIDDVLASTGDASATSADAVVDAMLLGRLAEMDDRLSRLLTSGAAPFLVLSAAMRQFQFLSGGRSQMEEAGRSAASVVASARPPLFSTRRATAEAALQRWNSGMICHALERLHRAVLSTRRQPGLAAQHVAQAMIALTVLAERAGRRSGA